MNSALTTASKITRSSTFWWSYARPRQNLVFQEFKKGVQKSIQTCEHLPRICTLGPLFFNFSKIGFSKHQGPQVGVHPPISRPQKVITFLTTTNGQNNILVLTNSRTERALRAIMNNGPFSKSLGVFESRVYVLSNWVGILVAAQLFHYENEGSPKKSWFILEKI